VGAERLNAIKVLWWSLCLICLLWSCFDFLMTTDQTYRVEIVTRHFLLSGVLFAPIGTAAVVAVGLATKLLGIPLIGLSEIIFISVIGSVVGYVQWFVLVPALLRRFRRRSQI
jgi:uncharacterized membrane protein YdjX (TVP38/TMEM64 family)